MGRDWPRQVWLPLYRDRPDRDRRDRLEILTALIDGPSFDPMFRRDVIEIPPEHPIYRWECVVDRCERPRAAGTDLCTEHLQQWARARERGVGKAAFLTAAEPFERPMRVREQVCRICPERPAAHADLRLCQRHLSRWDRNAEDRQACPADSAVAGRTAASPRLRRLPGRVCSDLADSPLGLCRWHDTRYRSRRTPGGARCRVVVAPLRAVRPAGPDRLRRRGGLPALVRSRPGPHRGRDRSTCAGCGRCAGRDPVGPVHPHPSSRPHPLGPDLGPVAGEHCREQDVDSLIGVESDAGISCSHRRDRQGDPARTAAGLLHPGRHPRRRLPRDRPLRRPVPPPGQPLRPDRDPPALAARPALGLPRRRCCVRPRCPRTAGAFDGIRRAGIELSAFLEVDAPERRPRPHAAARRAHAPVRRRPAPPRTRRAAVAGDQTA